MMHSASTSEAAAVQPWKRQKSSEGQDIISRLSDCIIAHILSFLPTNYAVRTSALSQRWRYMWTFVTKLCFSDNLLHFSVPFEEAKNRYIDFVCRVLLLLLNSATIQKFSLDISENLDPYHINLWISAISNKRVKNISVSIRSWINFNLSAYPLFKCQSLEELVLEMMCQCNIEVPTFVSLSSLTVLDLYGITLTCYSSNESKELTLNLPVLRKYKTTCCIWFGVKSVTIEAPLLEVVSLNCNLLSPPKPDDYELRAEIKFCASHLTRFSYEGIIPSDNIVLDADIASTSIGLYNLKETSVQETWIVLCKLLRINAKCLKLSLRVGWQYLAGTEHYLADIPVFGMLSDLLISSVTGNVLLGLLLKSPSLESLVFQLLDFDEELHNFAIVPECFLTTLKVVEFARFSGNESELSFAKFVMENARVLERIIFSCCPELCGLELEKVKEKLFLVKKSSSIVIVEYESVPGGFRRYLSVEDI